MLLDPLLPGLLVRETPAAGWVTPAARSLGQVDHLAGLVTRASGGEGRRSPDDQCMDLSQWTALIVAVTGCLVAAHRVLADLEFVGRPGAQEPAQEPQGRPGDVHPVQGAAGAAGEPGATQAPAG